MIAHQSPARRSVFEAMNQRCQVFEGLSMVVGAILIGRSQGVKFGPPESL
jgi:hypothetical protein